MFASAAVGHGAAAQVIVSMCDPHVICRLAAEVNAWALGRLLPRVFTTSAMLGPQQAHMLLPGQP